MKKFFSALYNPSVYDGALMLIYFLCVGDFMFRLVFVSGGFFSEESMLVQDYSVGFSVSLIVALMIVLLIFSKMLIGFKKAKHKRLVSVFLGATLICYTAIDLEHIFRAVYTFYAFE